MAKKNKIRWWPLWLILLGEAGALVFFWFIRDFPVRQQSVLATMGTALIAGGLTGIWFLFLSRIRWKSRFQGLGLVVMLLVAFAFLFEFAGMSGDLVPQFRFRYGGTNLVSGSDSLDGLRISDYPQFQGPHRNAVIEDSSIEFDWVANPPELLWKRPVGDAISGFSVSGQLAIPQEQDGDQEKIVAYGLAGGEIIWEHRNQGHYASPVAGKGPRSNPTIAAGRVFAMGSTGWLTALELDTGALLWSRNVLADHQRQVPTWGKSCSPLVVGDQVIVTIHRKALLAYSAEDGSPLWEKGNDGGNYGSPTLLELAGRQQVISFNSQGPAGYAAENGKPLWSFSWPRGSEHVALPVRVSDTQLLVSTGYGVGAKLLEFSNRGDALEVSELWHSIRLKSKFANFFVIGDYIYGLDDGILTCLELATGERVWKRGRYGHGQMILVGTTILLMAEDGRLVAIEPSPEGLKEISSFQALDGHTWNPPALAGELLVVRNGREAACYRLPSSS